MLVIVFSFYLYFFQFVTTASEGDNDTDTSSAGMCGPEAILKENGQTDGDDQPKVNVSCICCKSSREFESWLARLCTLNS